MNNPLVINNAMQAYQNRQYRQCADLLNTLNSKALPMQALGVLGQCYKHLGQFDAATDTMLEASKRFGNSSEIQNTLANIYKASGEQAKAVDTLNKAIAEFGDNYSLQYNLFSIYYRAQQYTAAIASLTSLLSTRPDDLKLKVMLAQCHVSLVDYDQAESTFNKLEHVELMQPLAARAWLAFLKEKGDYENAISFLSDNSDVFGKDPYFLKELADFHHLRGDSQSTIEVLTLALKQFPGNAELLNIFSRIRWLSGTPKPFEPLENSVVSHPTDVALHLTLAFNLVKAHDYQGAEECVDKLIQRGFRHPAIATLKGFCLREKGEIGQSLIVLRDMAKSAPKDMELLKELAASEMVAGNYDNALQMCGSLVSSEPWNMGSFAYYTTALKLAGRLDEYARYCDFQAFVKPLPINVPIGFSTLEEFHTQLKTELNRYHKQSENSPLDQSLRQGTQTLGNLFHIQTPAIQALKGALEEQIEQHIASLSSLATDYPKEHPLLGRISKGYAFSTSWSVRLRGTGFHKSHFHHKGWISSAYYIDLPKAIDQNGEGWIDFGRPEISRHLNLEPDYVVKPEEGTLVLFPSYLWHGTMPFSSNEQRMTVAFDLIPK